jgi:glycosyltransferase involved in cell wall biosynthesis
MSERKLLSICIPTYNRSKYLGKLLSCLYNEAAGLEDLFEICISDNNSSDNTFSIVEKWSSKLPIRYRKNGANILFDANLFRSVSLARYEFIWFLSDDDMVIEGSIARLMEYLSQVRRSKVGSVYINSSQAIGDTIHYDFKGVRLFDIEGYSRPLLNLSFLGSICVRRKFAQEIISRKISIRGPIVKKKVKDPYLFYDFPHSYLFLECALMGGKIVIVPEPCIRILCDSTRLSYEHRCYMSTLMLLFSMDLKNNYPWCNDLAQSQSLKLLALIRFLDILLRASLVARRPNLEEACVANYELSRLYFKSFGNLPMFHLCRMVELARHSTPFKKLLILTSFIAIKALKINVSDKPNNSLSMKKKMSMSISRANKYLGNA